MGRIAQLMALGLLVTLSSGCSEDKGPQTKEELSQQLTRTVDIDKLPPDQRAKLPNRGDGTPSGPPPQFMNDRTR